MRPRDQPAEGIDAGQVVCEVGVAPVKPAEFVIFRLAQFSGGTSLVNESDTVTRDTTSREEHTMALPDLDSSSATPSAWSSTASSSSRSPRSRASRWSRTSSS